MEQPDRRQGSDAATVISDYCCHGGAVGRPAREGAHVADDAPPTIPLGAARPGARHSYTRAGSAIADHVASARAKAAHRRVIGVLCASLATFVALRAQSGALVHVAEAHSSAVAHDDSGSQAARLREAKRLDDAMRKLVEARRPGRWAHGRNASSCICDRNNEQLRSQRPYRQLRVSLARAGGWHSCPIPCGAFNRHCRSSNWRAVSSTICANCVGPARSMSARVSSASGDRRSCSRRRSSRTADAPPSPDPSRF